VPHSTRSHKVYVKSNMKHFDPGSLVVIIVTFALFVMALFFTGFTHALLLEAGVFLVSVKLILMAYKASVSSKMIERELREIKKILSDRDDI
jgi:hypothetical protein